MESYRKILKNNVEDSDEPGGNQKRTLDFVCFHSLESLESIEEFFSAHETNCTFLNGTHSVNGYLCWDCSCCNICHLENMMVTAAKVIHSHLKWQYNKVTNGLVWSKCESEWK